MRPKELFVEGDKIRTAPSTHLDPSESELVAALRQAQDGAGNADGFATTAELADALGWNRKRIREELGTLKRRGLLRVSQGKRENLAGRQTTVPVYRLVVKQEAKNAKA